MSSVIERKNVWFAQWRDQNGKAHQQTTRVKVVQRGFTKNQTRQLALQVAAGYESASRGTPLEQIMDGIRAVAVASGFAQKVPSIADYLSNFPALGKERTEKNRQKAFKIFLEWLGMKASLPLTRLTTEMCREHMRYLLQLYRKGTVRRHRESIATAMNRAVDVDHYLSHSPMKGISLSQEMKVLGIVDDTTRRLPFTQEEMRTILTKFPQPYADLASTSFYAGGLRLGDVCLLKWRYIDFDKNAIKIPAEIKTGRARLIHLIAPLKVILLARWKARADDEEFVFGDIAWQYQKSAGIISSNFTAMLEAHGIKTKADEQTAGNGKRRRATIKSFHSIRHTVVSWARMNPKFSPDVVRETVGHASESIEQGYFTPEDDKQREVLIALAAQITTPPAA